MPTDFTRLDDDSYTYEYFLHQDVCRLCWSKEAEIDIDSRTTGIQNCIKGELIEKIDDCLNIDIRCENCPKKLCRTCCWKLEEFYDFKSFCREADRRLREIINSFSIPVKIETAVKILKNSRDSEENVSDDSNCLSSYCDVNTTTQEVDVNRYNNINLHQENKYEKFDFANCIENIIISDIKETKVKFKKSRNVNNEVIKKKLKCKQQISNTYCKVCRTEFSNKNELVSHNLTHGIEGNLYKCFGCDKRFKVRKARYSHEFSCKGLKEGYKCDICDRFLPLRGTYELHMIHHRKNLPIELPDNIFECTKCSMSFNTKLLLSEHIVTHENGKKTYVCETCGRVFSRHDYLYKHKLVHTGTKRYVCPHCDSKFAQRSSLTVHIRKHTGERPFSCDLCPQRCVSSSNLKAHRQTHMGHKQFECAVCSKKFGYKISLEEHISSVHERSPSFPCEHCGAIYSRLRGLRRHQSAKHRKQDKTNKATPTDVTTCDEKAAGKDLILACAKI